MPVAKSYSGLKQISEPFEENGRMYVIVLTDKKTQKKVRWYTEAEYERMYKKDNDSCLGPIDKNSPYYRSQKDVLGFKHGYITIFKGVKPEHEEWFELARIKLNRWWGWYIPSTEEVPKDLPLGVEPVRLDWGPIGNEEDRLIEHSLVVEHVRKVLLAASIKPDAKFEYPGKVGDRLEIIVKVIGRTDYETKYGKTYLFELQDQKGNYYKWKTAAKNWSVGTRHHIRGTVKEFDELNGEPATILTRCLEV